MMGTDAGTAQGRFTDSLRKIESLVNTGAISERFGELKKDEATLDFYIRMAEIAADKGKDLEVDCHFYEGASALKRMYHLYKGEIETHKELLGLAKKRYDNALIKCRSLSGV